MKSVLSALVPIPITSAMLVSSTIPENDYVSWSDGVTYGLGDRVINLQTHRIYESAKANNLGKDPTQIGNRVGTTIWWIDVGSTNRWKMFDSQNSTQSSISTSLTVVLKPGSINSIYLAGLDADSLTVSVKDSTDGDEVFFQSMQLEDSMPGDYYEFCFSPYRNQRDALINEIPPYSNPEITITLSKISGTILCGTCSVGDLRPLGDTQRGVVAEPKTYSYIKVNESGENEIKKRKAAKDLSATAIIDLEDEGTVLEIGTALLDVPTFWMASGEKNYSGARAFGLGSITLSYDEPRTCILSLKINGLI